MLKDAQSMFKTLTQTIQNWLDRLRKCQRFKELRKRYHPGMKDFRRGEANPWSLGFLQTWRQQSSARLPQCTSATRHRIRWCDFSNSLHRGDMGGSYSICIPTAWWPVEQLRISSQWQMIQTSCNISSATFFYFFASSTHLGYGLQLLHLQTRLRPPALASETVWQTWLRASPEGFGDGLPTKCFSRWSNGI